MELRGEPKRNAVFPLILLVLGWVELNVHMQIVYTAGWERQGSKLAGNNFPSLYVLFTEHKGAKWHDHPNTSGC